MCGCTYQVGLEGKEGRSGADLGEFPWELGLDFPVQKPHFARPGVRLLAPINQQEAKAQIKPLAYLLKSTTTVRL